jgi:hypothetical protein
VCYINTTPFHIVIVTLEAKYNYMLQDCLSYFPSFCPLLVQAGTKQSLLFSTLSIFCLICYLTRQHSVYWPSPLLLRPMAAPLSLDLAPPHHPPPMSLLFSLAVNISRFAAIRSQTTHPNSSIVESGNIARPSDALVIVDHHWRVRGVVFIALILLAGGSGLLCSLWSAMD